MLEFVIQKNYKFLPYHSYSLPKNIAYLVESARVILIEYFFLSLTQNKSIIFYDIVTTSNDNDVEVKFSEDEMASVEFIIVVNFGMKTVIVIPQRH